VEEVAKALQEMLDTICDPEDANAEETGPIPNKGQGNRLRIE
jgi:hypothetical protein